jgi:hypothetical protein
LGGLQCFGGTTAPSISCAAGCCNCCCCCCCRPRPAPSAALLPSCFTSGEPLALLLLRTRAGNHGRLARVLTALFQQSASRALMTTFPLDSKLQSMDACLFLHFYLETWNNARTLKNKRIQAFYLLSSFLSPNHRFHMYFFSKETSAQKVRPPLTQLPTYAISKPAAAMPQCGGSITPDRSLGYLELISLRSTQQQRNRFHFNSIS